MIARLFEHRSGRVIALCRMVLALVFFMALWLDPSQPIRSDETGYALLGAYLVLAAILFAIAMRSWWWDHRLGWPSLAIDVFVFLAAVYFTEGPADDFTSPFLAFFAYLMLAATIRWNWRVTAATGLVVTGLYLLVGLVLAAVAIEFNTLRFGRRVVYMLVLSLILIWFGLQRRDQHIARFAGVHFLGEKMLPPLEEALAYAIEQSGANGGAIAWAELEEPDVELRAFALASPGSRLGPERLSSETGFGDRARLFSADRQRSLRASAAGRPKAIRRSSAEPLADLLGLGETLAIPLTGVTGRGEILLVGIPGVCSDHVELGALIGREVGVGFDRHSSLALSRETALVRTRDALARDLHDSVAQSLAGAALRLEGLRNWIRAGHDPDPEILQLKEALRAEQSQVRDMIHRLRETTRSPDQIELAGEVDRLLAELAERWGVAIEFDRPAAAPVSAALAHEVGHLLREGVANAVRHGGARKIAVDLHFGTADLEISIDDDGTGFPPDAGSEAPRSIRERVGRLAGTLAVDTGPAGTALTIVLPTGEVA